jgi:hypothetical protein
MPGVTDGAELYLKTENRISNKELQIESGFTKYHVNPVDPVL